MKKAAYVIIGLAVLYLILCLMGPSSLKVERSIDIKTTSVSDLQHQLADLKFFHDHWSPWTHLDPHMKTTYSGVCCEPGSKYSWESEKDSVGKGSMTFNKFSNDSVLMTVTFGKMGDSKIYFITKPSGENMNVTWGMVFDIGFFGRAPMLFFKKKMDEGLGTAFFQPGLNNLKREIEKKVASYPIEQINWEAQAYIGKRGLYKFMELPKFFGETYPKIGEYFEKNKLKMYGAPSAIYFNYDENKMEADIAAVFLVKDKPKDKEWEFFEIPASKVLMLQYFGNYDKMGKAYDALHNYMKEKGMAHQYVVEEYITDPMSEKDTAKWQTNIYFVLK